MKVENLITDYAIEIVFRNTNFGTRTPREMIAKDLSQIDRAFHIGHTMQCCLVELGLIQKVSHKKYVVTQIGREYLNLTTAKPKLRSVPNLENDTITKPKKENLSQDAKDEFTKIAFFLFQNVIKMKSFGKGKFIVSYLLDDKDDYRKPAELILYDGKHIETFETEFGAKTWMAENEKELKEFEDFVIVFIPYKKVKPTL